MPMNSVDVQALHLIYSLCIVKVLLNPLKLSFYRHTHTYTHTYCSNASIIPSLGTHVLTKCTSDAMQQLIQYHFHL